MTGFRGNLPISDCPRRSENETATRWRGYLAFGDRKSACDLLHEQHLTGAFDRPIKLSLVVRRQAGVFAWQDSPLVGHELPQQVDIFEIERVCREIDFGFRPRRAHFHERTAASTAAVGLVRASFARHKLFDFAMERVASQGWIISP